MPFMKGRAAFRRTMDYLRKGELTFKDNVKVMSVNYTVPGVESQGTRDLLFWHRDQIQYKNPSVQIVEYKNMTPTPFIRFYLDTGDEILVDVDHKDKDSILQHIIKILGKTREQLKQEEEVINPANFGQGFPRWCICEVPGQVACPSWQKLPKEMTGKYKRLKEKGEDA